MSRTRKEDSRSSRSRGSISDIDNDDIEKYRNRAKSLTRDKEELKDKMRRLLDDIDDRNKEHRIELEKTQNYFQEQLDEERKQMEIMKQKYEQKMKKTMGTESQVVKRLENTIVTLQEKLRDEKQKYINENEEKMKQMRQEYVKEFQNIQKAHNQEKDELANRLYMEKDELANRLRMEKEQEVKKEVNGVITEKTSLLQHLTKKSEEKDRIRNDEIEKAKSEVVMCKSDYERKFNEFMISGKKSVEDLSREYESKMVSKDQIHKKETELMKKMDEKDIEILRLEKDKNLELVTINFKREIEEQKKVVSNLQKEILSYNEKSYKNVGKQDDETKKLMLEMLKKDKDIANLHLQYDKVSGEADDKVYKLKEQLNQGRENAKKLQDHAQLLHNQFIVNINKQKELADKEIYSRDQTIFQLDQQLKKMGHETVERFNMLDRKLKNTLDDFKNITEKYNHSLITVEKQEQIVNSVRQEFQHQKELTENVSCKLRVVDFEREKAESKCRTDSLQMEKIERTIGELRTDVQKYKALNDKLNDTNRSLQFDREIAEKRIKMDMEQKMQEFSKVKQVSDEFKVNYEKLQNLYADGHKKWSQSEERDNSKTKIISGMEKELENANKLYAEIKVKLSYFQLNYPKIEAKLTHQGSILIECEKTVVEQKSRLESTVIFLDEIKNRYDQCQEVIRKLEIRLEGKELECLNKEKAFVICKKDLEKSNKDISFLSTEITRIRKGFGDEKKHYEFDYKLQKEKDINELAKELSGSKATIVAYEQNRLQMEKELTKLMSEKDKFKTVSDTVPEKEKIVDDIKNRLMGLEKVVVEVEKVKQDMQRKYEIEAEKTLNINKLLLEKEKVVKEMADKASVLEHSLINQESLRKSLEKNLQSLTEKYKKVVESPDSDLQNRTREVSRLKEEISEIKTNYTIALNGLNAELKNRKDEIASLQVKAKDVFEKEAKIKELIDRITSISQQYQRGLDIMTAESKKEKEEINRLSMKQSIYEQQSNELVHVKEVLESLKLTYDKINSKLAQEKRVEVENATRMVSVMKEEVKEMKEMVEKIKHDCVVKIVEARKMPKEGIEKIEKYEIENKRLENILEASEKKISSLQSEMMQIIANTNAKNVFLQHKEDEIRRMEEGVRNAQPKLLDPSLRRDRDDALATLRQAQIELNITKEEVMQLSENVQISDKSIQDMAVEKQNLCKVQDDLNRTLNTMQRRHERDLGGRDQRIRELEAVIAVNQK